MMLSAFKNMDQGIQISYRTDGGVFNLNRLRAKTKSHWLLFVSCWMPMTALLSPTVSMIFNNGRIPSQLPPRGLGWRSVSRKQRCCFNLQEDPQPVHLRSKLTARSWTVLIPSHTLEAACHPPTPLTRKYLPVLQRQAPPMVGCRSEFGVTGGWA